MAKQKLYPYGDIPSPEVVDKFKEKKPLLFGNPLPPAPEQEDFKNPLQALADEMDTMWNRYKDGTTVYAMMNMD